MEQADIDRWQQEVLRPALRGTGPPPTADLPGGGLSLLSADNDHTQRYVFQSPRLTAIRGASMRLDQLNRQGLVEILRKNKLPTASAAADSPGCLVYCGGGSLLALVPAVLAEKLVQEIEALYPGETGTATITAVASPVMPTDLQNQQPAGSDQPFPLQRLMRRQGLALRQRKAAKETVPLFENSPFTRLCQACGRRPVTDSDELGNQICRVCFENGRLGSRSQEKGHWHERFQQISGLAAEMPQDLAAIGKASFKAGYVGYIYADGNSIGRFLEETTTLVDFSRRSGQLALAMEESVYAALAQHLRHGETDAVRSFEIITIGGDDTLLIVPADAALPVAATLCREFTDRLAGQFGQDAPSMSAGVVLAHDSNPIYFLHDLAHQLLKNAKRRSWEAARKRGKGSGQAQPYLDFMILKSQSTLATDLDDVRSSSWLRVENEQNRERCLLTGRPYTLAEIERLLGHTRRLAGVHFSPGQLHGLRPAFLKGRQPGLLYYLYQRARLVEAGRASLAAIEQEWNMDQATDMLCWRDLGKAADSFREYDTPLLDMLELRDFVTKEAA